MSYKPSRSSGVMFDKYLHKAEKYELEIREFIANNECVLLSQINHLSKCFYLRWINDNKKEQCFSGKRDNRPLNEYYCPFYYQEMFRRNIELVYKPFRKILI